MQYCAILSIVFPRFISYLSMRSPVQLFFKLFYVLTVIRTSFGSHYEQNHEPNGLDSLRFARLTLIRNYIQQCSRQSGFYFSTFHLSGSSSFSRLCTLCKIQCLRNQDNRFPLESTKNLFPDNCEKLRIQKN